MHEKDFCPLAIVVKKWLPVVTEAGALQEQWTSNVPVRSSALMGRGAWQQINFVWSPPSSRARLKLSTTESSIVDRRYLTPWDIRIEIYVQSALLRRARAEVTDGRLTDKNKIFILSSEPDFNTS
jgi:hypothetical protein